MKVVFMGTPEFAVASLKKIYQSQHEILAVVTTPDKQRGRGRVVSFTAVKDFAVRYNLRLLQPDELKEKKFIEELKKLDSDLFVVVAFRILPKEVYTIPKFGTINLHASLLPKYRGAAPIQWALINGEKETGVTTFFIEEKVDTGNIILQEKIPIDDEDNYGTLHDKLMNLGADVVIKTIDKLSSKDYKLFKQDNSLASTAPKITKEICKINWDKSAVEIHNLVRALSPYPGAFFVHQNKQYKIFKTRIIADSEEFANAFKDSRFLIHNTQLFAKTGKGILQILEIQLEGRKRMLTEEFLRGYKL
ncbi:methionyl-tRNA formyltransferase [Melioribacteraceae bacterium 4301-Me]|uniref:methionyl-tRNA formyltransferase n=1 Tax=Pyranulibacter aquaticus TaxID=3163344 RepID=UPI00359B4153